LVWLLGLALVLGTVTCYWPVRRFDFVNYDDPFYVFLNPVVTKGLTWQGLVWAFSDTTTGNWHPVTWLSHMLDCQCYGVNPGAHHLTSVLLHSANALLLFLVLRRMTGSAWRSAFVATLFAWHPVHVESVAWISERKDVLSGFFFLLTLWAYSRYAEARRGKPEARNLKVEGSPPSELRGQNLESKIQPPASSIEHSAYRRYYVLCLVLFALGLMSKPMLITLPFVLLLLDYWPLHWLRPPATQQPSAPFFRGSATSPLRLLLEKAPFFALALASGVVTFAAQKGVGAVQSTDYTRLGFRVQNALVSYATYLGKALWPTDMAVLYPLPHSFPLWQVVGAGLLLGAASAAALWLGRERRYLAVGWLWFIGTLIPVIGLVQAGMQARADRYTFCLISDCLSWPRGACRTCWPRIGSQTGELKPALMALSLQPGAPA
jgi:hypothetical protein